MIPPATQVSITLALIDHHKERSRQRHRIIHMTVLPLEENDEDVTFQ